MFGFQNRNVLQAADRDPCTDLLSLSMNGHNIGAYNLALFPREKNPTNNIPSDTRDLLLCIYSDEKPDPAEHDFDDCEIMAKFTVVRWSDVETLREGIGTLVVIDSNLEDNGTFQTLRALCPELCGQIHSLHCPAEDMLC